MRRNVLVDNRCCLRAGILSPHKVGFSEILCDYYENTFSSEPHFHLVSEDGDLDFAISMTRNTILRDHSIIPIYIGPSDEEIEINDIAKKQIVNFLNDIHWSDLSGKQTNWEYLCWAWNSQRLDVDENYDFQFGPMPDYTNLQ